MSLVAAVITAAVGFAWIGTGLPMLARFVLVLSCGSMAGFGFYHGSALRKTIHIDISGTGQIRIREAGEERPCVGADRPHVEKSAESVVLLPDSTLWPWLMMLRLQSESGKITVLPVLPDSMPFETFNAVAVVLRWIAGRNGDRERQPGKNQEAD